MSVAENSTEHQCNQKIANVQGVSLSLSDAFLQHKRELGSHYLLIGLLKSQILLLQKKNKIKLWRKVQNCQENVIWFKN